MVGEIVKVNRLLLGVDFVPSDLGLTFYLYLNVQSFRLLVNHVILLGCNLGFADVVDYVI